MGVRVPPLLLSFVQRARKSVEKKFDNPESTTEEPLFEDKCQKIGQNRIK
jgi:hypothetical protein